MFHDPLKPTTTKRRNSPWDMLRALSYGDLLASTFAAPYGTLVCVVPVRNTPKAERAISGTVLGATLPPLPRPP